MKRRAAAISVLTPIAALACAPLALADGAGDDFNNSLGIALGIGIVILSYVGLTASRRHFGRKRNANGRKRRQQAKSKKRRR